MPKCKQNKSSLLLVKVFYNNSNRNLQTALLQPYKKAGVSGHTWCLRCWSAGFHVHCRKGKCKHTQTFIWTFKYLSGIITIQIKENAGTAFHLNICLPPSKFQMILHKTVFCFVQKETFAQMYAQLLRHYMWKYINKISEQIRL